MSEVARDGVSGYICRSVRDIVKRVRDLSTDPLTVRRYVDENFSIDTMVKEHLILYQEILNPNEARSGA